MDNKKLARLLLGDNIYDELRARKVFNPLGHPFPMQQLEDAAIDWSSYYKHQPGEYTSFAYLISPTQRSGTNFLSHILNFHPEIEFPEGDDLPMEHCLYSDAHMLIDYTERLLTYWGKWVSSPEDLNERAKKMLADMGEGLISSLLREIKQPNMLLLKTPDAGGIGNIFHLFPEVRIICLIRDGRDTLESFGKSWGGKSTFKKMTERWADRVNQLMDLKQRAEASGLGERIIWVRYDELNEDQNAEMKKILEFLGKDPELYPWDELEGAPVLGSSAFKKEGNVHWEPVEKTKDFKPVNKWNNWTDSQRETFKKLAGSQLMHLGFEKNLKW